MLMDCREQEYQVHYSRGKSNDQRCKAHILVYTVFDHHAGLNLGDGDTTGKPREKLELRQCKNGLASVKNMVFEVAALFPSPTRPGKRAAISKLACVSQKRIRSYISLVLVHSLLDRKSS